MDFSSVLIIVGIIVVILFLGRILWFLAWVLFAIVVLMAVMVFLFGIPVEEVFGLVKEIMLMGV